MDSMPIPEDDFEANYMCGVPDVFPNLEGRIQGKQHSIER